MMLFNPMRVSEEIVPTNYFEHVDCIERVENVQRAQVQVQHGYDGHDENPIDL